jgi:hypothetical protein
MKKPFVPVARSSSYLSLVVDVVCLWVIGSHYVAQTGLKLSSGSSCLKSPEFWDYICAPPHPAPPTILIGMLDRLNKNTVA